MIQLPPMVLNDFSPPSSSHQEYSTLRGSTSNAGLPLSFAGVPVNGVSSIPKPKSHSIFHHATEIEQQNKFKQERVWYHLLCSQTLNLMELTLLHDRSSPRHWITSRAYQAKTSVESSYQLSTNGSRFRRINWRSSIAWSDCFTWLHYCM